MRHLQGGWKAGKGRERGKGRKPKIAVRKAGSREEKAKNKQRGWRETDIEKRINNSRVRK